MWTPDLICMEGGGVNTPPLLAMGWVGMRYVLFFSKPYIKEFYLGPRVSATFLGAMR